MVEIVGEIYKQKQHCCGQNKAEGWFVNNLGEHTKCRHSTERMGVVCGATVF